jgi:TPR repeat protein
MSRRIVYAVLVLVAAPQAAGAQETVRRIALVIGNAQYKVQPRLKTPLADAKAMAGVIRQMGFEVIEATDLDRKRMEETLARFYRAADGADVALVYYSGHAMQLGGKNYLMATDAKLESPYDFDFDTVSLDNMLDAMRAHVKRRIVLLDASRQNGAVGRSFVAGAGEKVLASEPGLARMGAADGVVVASAQQPGKLSSAPAEPLSPFTRALVEELGTTDQALGQVLDRAATLVADRTGGADRPIVEGAGAEELRLAERRPLEGFVPQNRLVARLGEPSTLLAIPVPAAPHDSNLALVFEKLPATGDIAIGDRKIWPGDRIPSADIGRLEFRQQPDGRTGSFEATFRIEGPITVTQQGRIEIELTDDIVRIEAERRARAEARAVAGSAVDRFARQNRKVTVEVPVGVGPRAIPVDLTTDLGAGDGTTARVELKDNTGAGRLDLQGIRVASNGTLQLRRLGDLTFDAPVGSENTQAIMRVTASDAVGSDGAPRGPEPSAEITLKATITQCDKLAGDRLDRQGVAGGVLPTGIDGKKAFAACAADILQYGDNARFQLQIGRALFASMDYKGAREAFRQSAAGGHARANYYLGALDGIGAFGVIDNVKANEAFAKGVEAGDIYAQYSLGKSLFYGRGIEKDTKRGLDLMMAAAEAGHTFAMNELGAIFQRGDGVVKDDERARRWYEEGVRLGDPYSMHNLGLIYLDGAGVKQDYARARTLFESAAKLDHAAATNELGRLAFHGWGQPKDVKTAANWFKKAADLGEPYAAFSYAWVLGTGALGKVDTPLSARYLARSVATQVQPNHSAAKDSRESLRLTPEPDKYVALGQALGRAETPTPEDLASIARGLAALGQKIDADASIDDVLIAAERVAWLAQRPRLDIF